jgi:hypothetical protein
MRGTCLDPAQPPAAARPGGPPQAPSTRTAARPLLLVLPVLAGAILITALIVRLSLRGGRLCVPPTYDDVAYLLDATRRLNHLEIGVGFFLSELWRVPPHAPLESLLAAIGFVLFGRVDWAPYAMNAVVVALWLGLATFIFRARPLLERLLILGLVGLMPITLMAVHEFRPDMLAATLMGWAVVLALDGPILEMRPRRLLLIGFALGMALIAKPTTCPSTLATVGIACAASALSRLPALGARWPARTLAAAALVLLGAAIIAGPYYLAGWKSTYHYIYDNVLGHKKHVWAVPGSLAFHLRYYIDGRGGQFQLGPFAYPILAIAGIGALSAGRLTQPGQRARPIALALATLTAFAIAAANEMKQPFLGLQFQVLLTMGAFLTVRLFLERGPRLHPRLPVAAAVLPLLLLAAILTFRWDHRWGTPRAGSIRESWRLLRQLDDVVKSYDPENGFVFVSFMGLVNRTNLELQSVRRRSTLGFVARDIAKDLEDIEPFLRNAGLIFAAQSGTGLTVDSFPLGKRHDEIIARLDADPTLTRIAEFPGLNPRRSFFVYRRSRTLTAPPPAIPTQPPSTVQPTPDPP